MIDWALGLLVSAAGGAVLGAVYFQAHARYVLIVAALAKPDMPFYIPRFISYCTACFFIWVFHAFFHAIASIWLDSPVVESRAFYFVSLALTVTVFTLVFVPQAKKHGRRG